MRPSPFLILFSISLLTVGCRRFSEHDYLVVCRDAFAKLKIAQQLNQRYTQVDHFIVEGGLGKQPSEWQTVAFIPPRFELTYVARVNVDYRALTATPVGAGSFVLVAASKITVLDGDRTDTNLDPKLERRFGVQEWEAFVRSGYDLGVLGIPKEEIHAVEHWDENVRGWRKDRLPIK